MVVSLYTSRVILNALGVEDFGIYNVVGGLVAMFSIVSGAINVAISRFLTFELGKKDQQKLNVVFSSAVIIQLFMCCIVILLAETIGLWFLNNHMTFPYERSFATNVIYQLSIVTFCISLLSLPYNSAIIAHEKMTAFAYVSIFETLAKLALALVIPLYVGDKLIFFSFFLVVVSLMVRIVYGVYCKRHFEECRAKWQFDRRVLKDMFTYAGWTYIGASSALLRDAGGNVLINIFYGPLANAARGIGVQVQHAVYMFAQNFMTALNPQITKNYAAGNYEYMKYLIFNGSRISYYMMLLLSMPIILNTHYILILWLKQSPQYTVTFVQLALLFVISESISNPLVTSASASGKIMKYQLLVGGLQSMNFPISWLFLFLGYPPYVTFAVAIIISQLCLAGRLYILRGMISLSARQFLIKVYFNIALVTIVALILPIIVQYNITETFESFILSCLVCLISTSFAIYFVGCSREERIFVREKIKNCYFKYRRKIK